MDRREFLKATAAGAAGVGAFGTQPGCAGVIVAARPELFEPARIEAFLSRLDAGLGAIDRGERLPDITAAAASDPRHSAMVKRALRSLYAVGAFGDLEIEEQAHPAVQARMADMLPEMAESLRESGELIESGTPDQARRVREALRRDPSLPVRLSEAMDGAGAESGVSARTRRKFRAIATHVGVRLRHHDAGVLAGEYVAKVRRVEAWGGDRASLERRLIAQMGEGRFRERQARFQAAEARWAEVLGPTAGAGDGDVAGRPRWQRHLIGAALAFGLGVLGLAVGLASADGGEGAGLIVATVGAVLLVTAVVLLIAAGVSAAIDAARGDPGHQGASALARGEPSAPAGADEPPPAAWSAERDAPKEPERATPAPAQVSDPAATREGS